MLLEEQHINNCFPHKQNDVGTALCATTEIRKRGLIGQYLGDITREGIQIGQAGERVATLGDIREGGRSFAD